MRELYPTAIWAALTIVSLSSCSAPPTSTSQSSAPASPTSEVTQPSASPSPSSPSPSVPVAKQSPTEKTVPVTLYKADSLCQTLVSEKVAVSAAQPMQAAIAKVLEARDSADFSVAGYRVSVTDGIATVDLRVAPTSKRKFQSLSSCEQLALFGSIRRTLTANPQWNVQSVQFTEKGEEIVL